MKVEFNRDLPIKAAPIDNHYEFDTNNLLDVEKIDMGGWASTLIKVMGYEKMFNSVYFKFYLHNKEIDIYRSGLLNNYRALKLPMICYMEG